MAQDKKEAETVYSTNHVCIITFHPERHRDSQTPNTATPMLLPYLSEGLFFLSCDHLIADMNEVQIDIDVGIYLSLGQADLTGDRLAFEVMLFVHLGSSENRTVTEENWTRVYRGCGICM